MYVYFNSPIINFNLLNIPNKYPSLRYHIRQSISYEINILAFKTRAPIYVSR